MQLGMDPVNKLTKYEYTLYYSIRERNFTISNNTNPILIQDKLEIWRLQHLGDISTNISEKIGRSVHSFETILCQKVRIAKCSSLNRSSKYLTLFDR